MKSLSTLLIIAFITSGCMEFNQNEVVYNHEIIGSWSNLQYSEHGMTMDRVKKLQKNTYGYEFKSNGTLIARQNLGWCGTPPIITADYGGTWKLENGKIIINSEYWGGETTQEWLIISGDNKHVTVQINHIADHPQD